MIGKTLAHYEILEQIGAGGMGAVYRARDTKLHRDVALKVLPPDAARDPERTRRFEREARAVAAMEHPNIVTIHSVEDVDGLHFLTMELVEGRTLSEIIPPGGLPLEPFLRIALPLTEAMSLAHAKGITHRDLKPANVMVDREGRVKVLDFGLAKLWFPDVDGGEEETIAFPAPLTEAGRVLGTAAYMSPEQVAGGNVDSRSDVFALGILFHELLSGRPPFRGDYPAAIMHAIVAEDAPRLDTVPDAVAGLVERCLRKAPAERFADASELRNALQSLTTGVSEAGAPVETSAARAAFDRCEWQEAYDLLHAAGTQRELSAAELELLASCAVWLSEAKEATQARERAHAAYAKAGQNASAARVALLLVADRLVRGEGAVAGGWLKRAERLLENEPECAEHGWLLRRQSMSALGAYDFATALERNDRCRAIADRFRDADLQTVALHDRGQILVARGDVEEGRALIDEAMAAAMSGEVTAHTVGLLFCRTLSVCDALADFNRAREW
ncbi:MAG TPA: protein kinase, partial [bacterium]|nr:protein kinase [bacterium]